MLVRAPSPPSRFTVSVMASMAPQQQVDEGVDGLPTRPSNPGREDEEELEQTEEETAADQRFHQICQLGKLSEVRQLLEQGGDGIAGLLQRRVGVYGYTPLHEAASYGHEEILSVRLDDRDRVCTLYFRRAFFLCLHQRSRLDLTRSSHYCDMTAGSIHSNTVITQAVSFFSIQMKLAVSSRTITKEVYFKADVL